MQITVNTDELLKELEKHYRDTVERLEGMVRGFAYEVSLVAIENTPLGNAEEYQKLYQRRFIRYGLAPQEGFAQGSWQVAFDNNLDFQELYGANSGNTAAGSIKTHMLNYKLGDSFVIGNTGPYIINLEGGSSDQAPDGIMQPTVDSIMFTYKADLVRYFNQGK